jgi:hypothetical protein
MRAIAEQATDYWHLMIDFFELLHGGNMEDLPVDTTMVTEEAHRVEILGKQYTSGSWVRFGTQISPSLKGAQIHSMYTIDQACYLVLDVYPESEESESEGGLRIGGTAVRRIVALEDMLYLNGMWTVGPNVFIEMGI